jgi:small subunit ribosomal protein S14
MAKKSMVNREVKREKLVSQHAAKRAALKAVINDQSKPVDERFKASIKLAELPRNSSATRLHNRCQLTGRPHAFYRKLKLSRIMLRDLASFGQIPGMVKASWYGGRTDDERSSRRYADPYPQRPNAWQVDRVDPRIQAARLGFGCAGFGRLYPRL